MQPKKSEISFNIGRKIAIISLPILSHHHAYRPVHGDLLEKISLMFRFRIVTISRLLPGVSAESPAGDSAL